MDEPLHEGAGRAGLPSRKSKAPPPPRHEISACRRLSRSLCSECLIRVWVGVRVGVRVRVSSASPCAQECLCGRHGGSGLGQRALRRPLSAPDRASGCPELRPASDKQPLGPHECRPATSAFAFHTAACSRELSPTVCTLALLAGAWPSTRPLRTVTSGGSGMVAGRSGRGCSQVASVSRAPFAGRAICARGRVAPPNGTSTMARPEEAAKRRRLCSRSRRAAATYAR
eukprot:scaffold34916_cov57-Phaeocystis_antarctica.AAC.3